MFCPTDIRRKYGAKIIRKHPNALKQEQLIKLTKTSFDFPVDIISFNLRESIDDRISLSWHLTSREKQKIKLALNSKENKQALLTLKKSLGNNNNL